MNRRDHHTEWCAQGHRCHLGEHRAEPIAVDLPGLGRAVLTRVQSSDGRQHAEVTLTVALHPAEAVARRQLLGLVHDLTTVLRRASRTNLRRAA